WVLLEVKYGPGQAGKGFRDSKKNQSRPADVAIWKKNARSAAFKPCKISDSRSFGKQWREWWISCNPAWRQTDSYNILSRESLGSRADLKAPGPNGLYDFLISLRWW
ncbi:hypothetical protein BT96DRAFT_758017, partial [Gymnopus androsaceus JB14]